MSARPDTRPVPRMDLPTWFTEILRQFPMVVVIGLAVWYAEKRVREKEVRLESRYDNNWREASAREAELRAEGRRDRDAEVRRLREVHAEVLATKDEQIGRLTDEMEDLRKQVANLARKLQG